MNALFNEIDPYAARWLRKLVVAGHIAQGAVEERSIADLKPADLRDVGQFHTFAGIGVWSHAARLAGWPDDFPLWTGSCPCQPFSVAGAGGAFDDERHLWPEWFRLIRECRPPVIAGEQVASVDGLAWLDAVHADLEGAGYAVAAFDLCAAGVGAPHGRQRLYFGAIRLDGLDDTRRALADHYQHRREELAAARVHDRGQLGDHAARRGTDGGAGRVVHADGVEPWRNTGAATREEGEDCGEGAQRRAVGVEPLDPGATRERLADASGSGQQGLGGCRQGRVAERGAAGGFWADVEWLECRDGKRRPTQPGLFPLADGVAARMGRLRAYGNAVVGPLAAAFLGSLRDCLTEGAL